MPPSESAADYIPKQPFAMLFNGQEIPQNCPFLWAYLGPHLAHSALCPCGFMCQTSSRLSQPSFHRRRFMFPILCYRMPLPHPKIAPFSGRIWTPSNTWSCGPTPPHMPIGISVGLAVFAISDTQTEHATRQLQ